MSLHRMHSRSTGSAPASLSSARHSRRTDRVSSHHLNPSLLRSMLRKCPPPGGSWARLQGQSFPEDGWRLPRLQRPRTLCTPLAQSAQRSSLPRARKPSAPPGRRPPAPRPGTPRRPGRSSGCSAICFLPGPGTSRLQSGQPCRARPLFRPASLLPPASSLHRWPQHQHGSCSSWSQ